LRFAIFSARVTRIVIAPRSPQHFFFFFFLGLHLSCVFFFFFLAGHGHGGQKTSGFGGGGHSASCNSSSSTSVSVSRERRRLRDRAHVRSSMTRRVLLHTSHSHSRHKLHSPPNSVDMTIVTFVDIIIIIVGAQFTNKMHNKLSWPSSSYHTP